jgi:hypothetical protein
MPSPKLTSHPIQYTIHFPQQLNYTLFTYFSTMCAFAADTQTGFCRYYPSWRDISVEHAAVLSDIAARVSESRLLPANTTYPSVQFMQAHLPHGSMSGPIALLSLGLCYPFAFMFGAFTKSPPAACILLIPGLAFTIAGPIYTHIKSRAWFNLLQAAADLPEAQGLVDSVRAASRNVWGLLYSGAATSGFFIIAALIGGCLYAIGRKQGSATAAARASYAPVDNSNSAPAADNYMFATAPYSSTFTSMTVPPAPTDTGYPLQEQLPKYAKDDPEPPVPYTETAPEESKGGAWSTYVGHGSAV